MNAPARSIPTLFWCAILVIVAAAYLWRPAVLGYYGDDFFLWVDVAARTANFSAERWAALEIASNRPVLRAILFVLGSLLPGSAVPGWQIVAALTTLGTAIPIGWLLAEVLRLLDVREDAAKVGAMVGAAFWLLFPWGTPNSFWPTGSTTFFAVALFAAGGALLIRHWNAPNWRGHLGAGLTLLSYLIYEALYFQVFPLMTLLAVRRGWHGRRSATLCASYVLAHLAAVVFNRLMRASGAEGSRALNLKFHETYLHWLLSLGRKIGLAEPTVIAGFIAILIGLGLMGSWLYARRRGIPVSGRVLAVGTFLALVYGLVFQQLVVLPYAMIELIVPAILVMALWLITGLPPLNAWTTTTIQAAIFGGVQLFLGGATFALGNYVMFSAGIGGRTTLAINVWLALLVAQLAARLPDLPTWRRRIALAAVALSCLVMLAATGLRGRDWAASWTHQHEVISHPAAFDFAALGPAPAFIFIGPELSGWVPVFENNWIMGSAAVAAFLDSAENQGFKHRITSEQDWTHRWMVARQEKLHLAWDGKTLRQASCDSRGDIIAEIETGEVWVWEYGRPQVYHADKPFEIGCGARVGL